MVLIILQTTTNYNEENNANNVSRTLYQFIASATDIKW